MVLIHFIIRLLLLKTFNIQAREKSYFESNGYSQQLFPEVEETGGRVDIYRAAERRSKYLSLGTDTEEDNCFNIKLTGEQHFLK